MTVVNFARSTALLAVRLAPKIAGAAASFIFLFVVAHSSSIETYSQAAVIISIAGLAAPFSSIGQRFVVLRNVPSMFEEHAARAAEIIGTASRISIAGSAATAIFAAASIWLIDTGLTSGLGIATLSLCALLFFFQGTLEYTSQVLRAVGEGNLSIYLREVSPRVLALALLACLTLTPVGFHDLAAIIAALCTGAAASLALSAAQVRRRVIGVGTSKIEPAQFKEGFKFLPRIGAATAREYLDVLLLGLVAPPAAVALYFTLSRFSALLVLPGTSLSTNAVVEATRLHANGNHSEALAVARQLFAQSAVIVLPIAVVLLAIAPRLLQLFSISAEGYGPTIFMVVLNGAVVGTFLGIWELMQCFESTRFFHKAFPLIVALGAVAMYLSAVAAGAFGLATAYLVMNAAWISLGMFELFSRRDEEVGL